jgi:hypothetical protein
VSSILSSFSLVSKRFVLLTGMLDKFQICCTICSVSSINQNLSKRKEILGGPVMQVNDNLSGA